MKLDQIAAATVVGLTVVQLHSIYNDAAPSLTSLREAHPDSAAKNLLMDADLYVGGLAVLIGGSTAYLTRSIEPLLLTVAGFFLISIWHHAVLNADHE